MRHSIIFIIMWFVLLLSNSVFAWEDKNTHPKLTEKAVGNSAINNHLKNNLDLTNGLETMLKDSGSWLPFFSKTKTIQEWIEYGSTEEDSPACRASNHFHNPINQLAWSEAGLNESGDVHK